MVDAPHNTLGKSHLTIAEHVRPNVSSIEPFREEVALARRNR